ncbi:MAG: Oxygen-independent coproporphyrinogen-III oxidase-like protein YqeR [Myxococcota bacterium]|nr:Oxygen-independent coproporphyrinogen-III oxidase-like protein YqeR [Myxococcota bacterium]
MIAGVYIHYPACLVKCPYCDFASGPIPGRTGFNNARYAGLILRELESRRHELRGRLISVYFGGGTPSLWGADPVGRVLNGVRTAFPDQAAALEVTLEVNPATVEGGAGFRSYREAGVNRVSIGVQTTSARLLQSLERAHTVEDGLATFQAAREAGFDNISLDLIFGLPGQSRGQVERDVRNLLALQPDHLSIYSLIVEPGTRFGALHKAGKLHPAEAEAAAAMFMDIHRLMTAAGYEHYEISNFARPGKRAVHNTLYWTGGAYLGLGNSAHSFEPAPEGPGGVRRANLRGIERYLTAMENGASALEMEETIAGAAAQTEFLMTRLRMAGGLPLDEYARFFGGLEAGRVRRAATRWVDSGYAEWAGGRLRLTPSGLFLCDEVVVALMPGG